MALAATATTTEQTRARYPDQEGFAVREDGTRIFWESYGTGEPTLLFVPPWSIIHSRGWKMQLPYFGRHFRAVCFDPRGNGKSDRPEGVQAYSEQDHAADLLAVMDESTTERAVIVTHSLGAQRTLLTLRDHPERVMGAIFIAPAVPLAGDPAREEHSFTEPLDTDEGWAKHNVHHWRRDYRDYLEFFFSQAFREPRSTKQIEDCVNWGLETDPETLIATFAAPKLSKEETLEICARVSCPVWVIHGTDDGIRPHKFGAALAEAIPEAHLITLDGSGHNPHARDPVKVNLLIREFVEDLG